MPPALARLSLPPGLTGASDRNPLWGFGAQFDTDLFTLLGQPHPVTEQQLGVLRTTIKKLKLGHSRIFVRFQTIDPTPNGAVEREVLMKTIELAQQSGVDNVNLTWWQGPYPPAHRKRKMEGFAGIIEEARERGFACVTHATIQNEVNNQNIAHKAEPEESMKLYRELYVLFNEALRARQDPLDPSMTLREAVKVVGGDLLHLPLVQPPKASQDKWLAFMHTHMADLLDGHSVHVYWTHEDFKKFEARLAGLEAFVGGPENTKPMYVTEYGVRGTQGKKPGTVNGTNVEDTIEAAFEHGWFNALAAQRGCVGFAKWALYRTDGPKRPFGGWGMIAPPKKSFALTPTCHVTRLFNHAIEPGWKATVHTQGSELLISAFAAPEGSAHSVMLLNRRPLRQRVTIEGLGSAVGYFAAVWNRGGDGVIHGLPRVLANADGVATVDVPPRGIVGLSSRPLGLG